MFSRAVLGRFAADVPKTSTHDVAQLSRSIQQLSIAHRTYLPSQSTQPNGQFAFNAPSPYRTYATTQSKTTNPGTPTPKVRAAVKKAAKEPATRTRKTTTTRKAASGKKKTATTTTKRKPAAKRKTTTKKKAAAKPKAKSKRKTPKQKEAAALKKTREDLKELRAAALLTEPKPQPATAWTVFVTEAVKNTQVSSLADSQSTFKDAAAKYKSLSPAELEHYNHLANEAKAANSRAYKAWVESHTPDQIRVANHARQRLKQREAQRVKAKGGSAKHVLKYPPIKDERQIKRPTPAFVQFYQERLKSGDMKHIAIKDASKLAKQEWEALSEGEKKKYFDLQADTQARYAREFKSTYGHEPTRTHARKAAASASA